MLKWRIGEVTVTRILELEATGGARFILPDATPEACREIARLQPHSPVLVGAHFANPTAGRVVRDGDAWRFAV